MSTRSLAALAWTTLLLGLCLAPARWLPQREDESPGIPHTDKLVHLALFGGFGVLWLRRESAPARVLRLIGTGVALAVLTEAIQGVPGIDRDPDPLDLGADLLGLLGAIAVWRWRRGSPVEVGSAGSTDESNATTRRSTEREPSERT